MGYFDEFCQEAQYEPSDVDEILAEAKLKLQELVKDNTGRSIKDIVAENKLLKSVVEVCNKEKRDYESMKRNLQNEHNKRIDELEKEFYRSKISEIFAKCNPVVVGYTLNYRHVSKPKCGNCDDNRNIIAVDTTGVEHLIKCSCSKISCVYEVQECSIVNIGFWKNNVGGNNIVPSVYYHIEKMDNELIIDNTHPAKDVFDPSNPGSDYRVLYTSAEEAQKHCDFINKKDGVYVEGQKPKNKGKE